MFQHETTDLRQYYCDQATAAYNGQDFEAAEKLYRQALAISERSGSKGKELAFDLGNVARSCHHLGKFDEASIHYRKAVGLLESLFGPRHPVVADGLHDLARVECSLGNFQEGYRLFQRVISTRIELFGSNDPRVIATQQEAAMIPASFQTEGLERLHVVADPEPQNEVGFDDIRTTPSQANNVIPINRAGSQHTNSSNGQFDSRRRLPRSFVGDPDDASNGDYLQNHQPPRMEMSAIFESLSTFPAQGPHRTWFYLGAGLLAAQLVIVSLMAIFGH
jgi:tetratricopeptide (TPR) repeat protein